MSSHAHAAIAPEPATSAAAQYCLGEYFGELGDRFDGGFDLELSLFPSLDEFARRSASSLSFGFTDSRSAAGVSNRSRLMRPT